MNNLTRFDPIDELFKGFFIRPANLDKNNQLMGRLSVDVNEDEKNYYVNADLPGVKKEDIHVHVEANSVSISATRNIENTSNNGKSLLVERSSGKVSRSFTLPNEIDEANANAKFNEGVLTLTLPKKVNANPKKLSID